MTATVSAESRPRLRPGTRLTYDQTRGTQVLLFPEGVIVPNETASAVLSRCDGVRTVADIADSLATEYHGVRVDDVVALLDKLVERRFVEVAE
jgi:pyrroloquinoline quinone biosynthesis protein D